MLRKVFIRNYWTATKTNQTSNIIKRLEEVQISISKIVNATKPITCLEKKELANQLKKLDENIVLIKKNSDVYFDLTKYT